MDDLGLPIAFGKPQQQAKDESRPARGASSSRGDRGVVGGGKKNKRGRGAAPTETRPTEWPRGENLASQYDAFNGGSGSNGGQAFNGGVKRAFGSHQPRQEERGRGRGRGRGGAPRGRGGYTGPRRPETFHGRYLKESMWDDPWAEIIAARQAGTA